MYSQRGGMVADNFHGDVEEFCEVFGPRAMSVISTSVSYHIFQCVGCKNFVKFSPSFTQLTEIGARFRKSCAEFAAWLTKYS